MEDRKKPLLMAAILTLTPMILVFPVLALARFGPTGPQSVWPIVLYAPVAMWMETRAIKLLLQSYRNSRDPILIAILPLGMITLFGYVLHGALFILGLPAFLYRFI
jgi:hypothetical protein